VPAKTDGVPTRWGAVCAPLAEEIAFFGEGEYANQVVLESLELLTKIEE
jgi:hypothetical protein